MIEAKAKTMSDEPIESVLKARGFVSHKHSRVTCQNKNLLNSYFFCIVMEYFKNCAAECIGIIYFQGFRKISVIT